MYPSNRSQYPCIDHALKQCGDDILEYRHMADVETCFSMFCSTWARFWNCLRVCFKQVKAFKNGLLGAVYKKEKKKRRINRDKFLTTWKSRTNPRTVKRYEASMSLLLLCSLCKLYRFHVTLGLFTNIIEDVKIWLKHQWHTRMRLSAAQCRIFVFATFWSHLELLNRRTAHCNMESIR